ncbi:lactate dehydrogenase-like 2-hydroxyacid dehydrogenase [Primorskyibacter sedentarius]|uniref:Lactate dehydrogenase-like 2-hydroxyacid dehydrogenase n=1 Tax=Primorskyibacter sedentarius TaxID=745311 RepID=A0A4R3JM18_9RHOB|nr:2-hydroxyacid dehydrogenase [Primorskyibacter sedentarius]TCS66498.1 lactate dehydrogenase-like 2-hydroxyacid dehydrogenase [Primorskyibacter sedentarius]
MKPEVLVLAPTRPRAWAQLEEAYTLHRYDEAEDKAGFLAEHGPKCRAIVTNGHETLTRQMVEAMPNLGIVACSSAGYEAIDVDALTDNSVKLTNTSPALCDDVADTAVMLMLAARRGLIDAHAYTSSGDWGRKGMFPLQHAIKGARLGIVGMGTIGQAIAARCAVMGMDIAYFGRRKKPGIDYPYVADLTALAAQSDVLVLAIAGGDATRGLVDAAALDALGPDGLLVNIARGTVVDEAAMIDALKSGRLGRAALDVYLNEPEPDPALTCLPNVTLYPHHASGTVETRDAMAQMVVDNLAEFYANRPLLSAVN